MKTYSGFTQNTAKHLQLDAGAFFINYNVNTDTYDAAVSAGKLLGATRGGGQFNAVPNIRQIQVDGIKGKAKGLEALDSWDVNIQATVLELNEDTIKKALVTGINGTSDNEIYNLIEARNNIELSDYVDNVTWVGTISGSNAPLIIQVENALNTQGLGLQVQDANEGSIQMKFDGHYSTNDLNKPPFKIYYPKDVDSISLGSNDDETNG